MEERQILNTASKTTVATVPKFQWVWGTRYIDEVILRDENKDGDGDCVDGTDQRLYVTQDANFNVTALLDTAGTVVERILYDAYGKRTLYNAAWSATQASTLYNNEVLYAGYRLDPESGLYQVRHRHYHPTLGRWVQRDPIRYHDGMNPYEYVRGKTLTLVDPSGLQAEECCLEKDKKGNPREKWNCFSICIWPANTSESQYGHASFGSSTAGHVGFYPEGWKVDKSGETTKCWECCCLSNDEKKGLNDKYKKAKDAADAGKGYSGPVDFRWTETNNCSTAVADITGGIGCPNLPKKLDYLDLPSTIQEAMEKNKHCKAYNQPK